MFAEDFKKIKNFSKSAQEIALPNCYNLFTVLQARSLQNGDGNLGANETI
jgi:hypothetical protein